MGYRHYMYIVPRKQIDDVKNLTYEELTEYARTHNALEEDEDGAWVMIHDLFGRNEFHEFGKYYENADNVYKLGVPLFTNPDTQEAFSDYEPYVVGREAVLCAIEDYRKKIVEWYSGLLMSQEEADASDKLWALRKVKQEDRIKQHLESQKEEWENRWGYTAVDTSETSTRIVRSWLYEYAIFELVHQLKMMDWENNTLLFYGW